MVSLAVDVGEKRVHQRNHAARRGRDLFVPEGTPLSMQLGGVSFSARKKVGLVVNEYGDIQGLVTVEDILEEIVGDFTTSMSPTLAE